MCKFAAGLDGDLLVTLSKRESVIGRMNVEAVDGSVDKVAKFELAESDADGVLIATVWDSQGNPLAERLVFRQPAKQVRVKISADAEQYVPGGTARLTIETTDESGKPLSAVVGLAVTDDSVLEMIEKPRAGSAIAGDGVAGRRRARVGRRSCLSGRGE